MLRLSRRVAQQGLMISGRDEVGADGVGTLPVLRSRASASPWLVAISDVYYMKPMLLPHEGQIHQPSGCFTVRITRVRSTRGCGWPMAVGTARALARGYAPSRKHQTAVRPTLALAHERSHDTHSRFEWFRKNRRPRARIYMYVWRGPRPGRPRYK